MINYEWKITNVEAMNCHGHEDVCVSASYECKGTKDNLIGIKGGSVKLLPPEGDGFLSLPEITEPMIVDWVKAALGVEGVLSVEQWIAEFIARQEQPKPTSVTFDWMPKEEQ